ncbi:MAG: hypothetical protein KKB20_07765 [Proteobacteria bacterium]|nr:hypothetical protein [Pseudomonadota bacterium]
MNYLVDYLKKPNWYAIHTKSNFEILVQRQLAGKDYQAFLPMIKVNRPKRNRYSITHTSMFPGYLFVNAILTPNDHLEIVKCRGVVRLVGIKGTPYPVNPDEINNLMILDGKDVVVAPHRRLQRGDRVVIVEGPLEGLKGIYLNRKGTSDRIVISVDFITRAVAVELDGWSVARSN